MKTINVVNAVWSFCEQYLRLHNFEISTVKQIIIYRRFRNIYTSIREIDNREIKIIMFVMESCAKSTILIRLQTKVKIINPFGSICNVFNPNFLAI